MCEASKKCIDAGGVTGGGENVLFQHFKNSIHVRETADLNYMGKCGIVWGPGGSTVMVGFEMGISVAPPLPGSGSVDGPASRYLVVSYNVPKLYSCPAILTMMKITSIIIVKGFDMFG